MLIFSTENEFTHNEASLLGVDMHAREIIGLFGSQSALAAALGKSQSTLSLWAKAGVIPAKSHVPLLKLAAERGIELSASDFIVPNEKSLATKNTIKTKD